MSENEDKSNGAQEEQTSLEIKSLSGKTVVTRYEFEAPPVEKKPKK